jgi:2-dehydro-3-deoxygluconokinase
MAPIRVASFGECMLELQGPAFGSLRQGHGGDTLNAAVYLARCGRRAGIQVDYATALGDDGFSDAMAARWQAEGVGTALVRRLPGRLPGLYWIETDGRGERRFSYWRDSAAARSYFDTPPGETPLEQAADGLHALHFSGISLAILPPDGRRRLLALAERLRERGACVAFDNNYRPRLWPDLAVARECFAAASRVATLALMTLDDEQALWAEPDAERQLAQTLALPAAEVVVKRGAAPTLVRTAARERLEVPVVPVDRVVDTTAAGDSFAGAYLAARLAGASPQAAAAAGNALAGRVIQHPGALIPADAMADLTG